MKTQLTLVAIAALTISFGAQAANNDLEQTAELTTNIRYNVAASSVPASVATNCSSSGAGQSEKGGASYSTTGIICDNLTMSKAFYAQAYALQNLDPALSSEYIERSNEHLETASLAVKAAKKTGIIERVLSPVVKLVVGIFGILSMGVL